jgi:diguanylate cyclase (GGDEF)-like protein
MRMNPSAAAGQTATARRPWARGWLRLALGLATGVLAAIVFDRLGAPLVEDPGLRSLVAAGLAAAMAGVTLQRFVMRPMHRTHAELHDRYQEALADALQDPLTGLGNHRAFQEELDRQVEEAQRYGKPVALVLIDLDEFKTINDTNGHANGDRALASFGRLMTAGVRRVDRSFRIGGDEFAILLPHTDAEGAWVVTRRLLANALQPTLRDEGYQPLSFSAGVSALPAPADGRSQLYSQADAALYAAKRSGRTEVVIFDTAAEAQDPAGSGAAVAEVIARGQLRPVYQPIIQLRGGEVLGYEGLTRPVPPAPFADPGTLFAAAEASGHVVQLDMSCLEMIVAGARDLPATAFLSVNLSPRTLESVEFSSAALLNILARHRFAPQRLVLELTEQQPINDVDRIRLKIEGFRRTGIRIAADDLGAGNAGLRLLSELHFDVLKVDLSLVQRSATNDASSAVISSVVGLAARTGALVIAEGVERPDQLPDLDALGVGAGQGYLLGRPGPLPAPGSRPAGPSTEVTGRANAAPMLAWRQSIGLPT